MIRSPTSDRGAAGKEQPTEFLTAGVVLVLAIGAYGLLFNRANVLSHSIGYNLYASERVLDGDFPYRDFHTLYPPAIFYLNAALFKWMGVSLHTALIGVLVFKALTVVVIYLSGREVMPRAWALPASLSTLFWLRPNGPFKSVPMHYGALFLALAMCLLLKYANRRKLFLLLLAGASVGMVALFKHNIGAYALAGSIVYLIFENLGSVRQTSVRQTSVCRSESKGAFQHLIDKLRFVGRRSYRPVMLLLIGCAAAIAPALIYLQANHALSPMIRTMIFGPGEFLLSRLAIPLSPVAPLVFVGSLAAMAYATSRLRSKPTVALSLELILIAAIFAFILGRRQSDIDQIIFYLPMLVLGCGLGIAIFARSISAFERRSLLIMFVFAAAALMELFPRFAREQSIAAMPFVVLFLFYLLYAMRPAIRVFAGEAWQYGLALAVLPITFALMEGRLFFNTCFDSHFRFRANTQVDIERGRGVYFPPATAALIGEAVSYIQQRVPPDGNAVAQSDAGTSLLFLAGRRNASNAQFWIGVGVSNEERVSTLERIDKSRTKLIITSDDVLAAEKYEPMREYIQRNFKPSARFDDVVMLER